MDFKAKAKRVNSVENVIFFAIERDSAAIVFSVNATDCVM